MSARSYRDLEAWNVSVDLAVETYHLVRRFPPDELFVLSAQARRAAGSVPSNTSEGNGRAHRKEYLHHLSMAQRSLNELDTDFVIAERLGFLSSADLSTASALQARVGQMLTRLRQSLRRTT